MSIWDADPLGAGYEQRTIDLGSDPDGEAAIVATLVRHLPQGGLAAAENGAVLHVHGFTDYFFQRGLAQHFTDRGYAFYALDLRKCGRSQRPGHTPHFVSNLALYDVELNAALKLVREDLDGRGGGVGTVVMGHSTGGLVVSLWLDRLNTLPGGTPSAGVTGLVLNSPWFDLQGAWYHRSVGTQVVDAVGRNQPYRVISLQRTSDAYGASLHASRGGEWDYDLGLKPMGGYPARYGWLRAVRRGHARLHRGLDVGVPSLVLRSVRSHFALGYSEEVERVDCVLDVRQIARWAGCLGGRTLVVPVEGAKHDVFLSRQPARDAAYAELDSWLAWHRARVSA